MIQGIVSNSPYLIVANGTSSNYHISINSAAENAGAMRWTSTGIEVFNGSTWQHLHTAYPSVCLSSVATTAIEWAIHEMQKQNVRKATAQSHPALANAYAAIERAEEQFDMLDSIIRSNTNL